MRLYPDTADDRGRAVAKDALVLLTLFVLAWLALKVHHAVDQLAVLGSGVRESGEASRMRCLALPAAEARVLGDGAP